MTGVWVISSPFGNMEVVWEDGIQSCAPVGEGQNTTTENCPSSISKILQEMLSLRHPFPMAGIPKHPLFPDLWQVVSEIPTGETRTYGELCRRLGLPSSYVRAVARALGSNRLCILVPCHRVVRKNGTIGGYKWGSELKQKILDYEKELLLGR